jgi:SAM-dependent methyltransferase
MFAHCTLLDAKEAASADRALSQVEGLSTVYGEAAFCSLAAVLARHWRGRGLRKGQGKFVDIGHGSGRALLGAHLLHDFQSIMGVEILRTLVGQSRKVLRRAQTELKEELQRREEQRRRKAVELGVEEEAEEGVSDTATAAAAACSESDGPASLSASPSTGPSFTLLHGDFRDVDFSDADVLFVNSTVFDEDLMHDLSLYARRLKRGSLIVTYTHALKDEEELIDGTDQQHLESVTADGSASQRPPPPPPTRHFRILSDDMFEQSWGWCTVYVQRKLSPPCWDPIRKRPIDDMDELDKVAPEMPKHLRADLRADKERQKERSSKDDEAHQLAQEQEAAEPA